jgi:hypothetical protein
LCFISDTIVALRRPLRIAKTLLLRDFRQASLSNVVIIPIINKGKCSSIVSWPSGKLFYFCPAVFSSTTLCALCNYHIHFDFDFLLVSPVSLFISCDNRSLTAFINIMEFWLFKLVRKLFKTDVFMLNNDFFHLLTFIGVN